MNSCHGSISSHNGASLMDCHVCGYIHVYPKLTQDVLDSFYKEDFYQSEKPDYIARYIEDQDWWKLTYGSRLDYFETLNVPKKSILDVGSGPGLFLKYAKEQGWDELGIEPSPMAVEYTKSINCKVLEGFFDRSLLKDIGKFGAIHASEVLEHVPNPQEMLNLFNEALLPDGLICICVPNDFNIFQKIYVQDQSIEEWWVNPAHHLNYFSHKTLVRLMEQANFKVERITSTFPIDLFLLFGDKYIGNDVVGRSCHKKRMNFELLLNKYNQKKLHDDINDSFAKLGLGREIVVYARKQ